MAADILGLDKPQESKTTTTDFLGQQAPLAFSAQPALPAGGPAGAGGGPSAAPPTIAGTGVAPAQAPGAEPGFAELSQAALGGDPGGDSGNAGGAVGAEGGSASGLPGVSGAYGPFDFGASPFGAGVSAGKFGVGIGPTGTASAGLRTGNPTVDSVLNSAFSMLSGVPTSVNLPGLFASLIGSPLLSTIASAASTFGAPLAAIQLAHQIAQTIPGSTVNMQGQMATPNPETMLTAEQAAQGLKYGFENFGSPKFGGAQPIGALAPTFETAIGAGQKGGLAAGMGLGQGLPGTPEGPPAPMFDTFADLAAALGFGRTDTSPTGPAPAGPGPSASVSGGEESGGGPGPGPGDTSDGATGDF